MSYKHTSIPTTQQLAEQAIERQELRDQDDLPAEIPEQLAETAASAMFEFDCGGRIKWANANSDDRKYWLSVARVGLAAVVPLFGGS